ncbi:hypothetical protein EDB85DRAFT_1886369 [Lactarius pseudohatsudake]|nr:hypothetical protein EDB85DRAFT_1886369 [Lactarius pseudohatsudake]
MGKGAGGGMPSRTGRRSRGKGKGRGQRGEGQRALVCPFPRPRGKGGDVTPSVRMGKGGGDMSSCEWEGMGREEGERAARTGGTGGGEGEGRRSLVRPLSAQKGWRRTPALPFHANGTAGRGGRGGAQRGGTACPRAPRARTGRRSMWGKGKKGGGRLTLVHPCLHTNGAACDGRDIGLSSCILFRRQWGGWRGWEGNGMGGQQDGRAMGWEGGGRREENGGTVGEMRVGGGKLGGRVGGGARVERDGTELDKQSLLSGPVWQAWSVQAYLLLQSVTFLPDVVPNLGHGDTQGVADIGETENEKGKMVEGRVSEVTPTSREVIELLYSPLDSAVLTGSTPAFGISHPSLDSYRVASEARPARAQAHLHSSGPFEAGHMPGSRDGCSSGPIPKAPGSDSETGREIDRSPDVPFLRYPLGLLLLPILSLARAGLLRLANPTKGLQACWPTPQTGSVYIANFLLPLGPMCRGFCVEIAGPFVEEPQIAIQMLMHDLAALPQGQMRNPLRRPYGGVLGLHHSSKVLAVPDPREVRAIARCRSGIDVTTLPGRSCQRRWNGGEAEPTVRRGMYTDARDLARWRCSCRRGEADLSWTTH